MNNPAAEANRLNDNIRRYGSHSETLWALDQVKQVAFDVFKEQYASAAGSRPDLLAELHTALFEFGPGDFNGIDP